MSDGAGPIRRVPSRAAVRQRRRQRRRRRIAGAVLVVSGLSVAGIALAKPWADDAPVTPDVQGTSLERTTTSTTTSTSLVTTTTPAVAPSAVPSTTAGPGTTSRRPGSAVTAAPAVPATAVGGTSTTIFLPEPTVPVLDR